MTAIVEHTGLGSMLVKRRIGVWWERRGRGTGSIEDVRGRDMMVDSVSMCRRPAGWSRRGYEAEAGCRSRMMGGIGS